MKPFVIDLIDQSKAVFVYRNLHLKPGGFSVKQNGRVLCHTTTITLKDVKFVVQKSGRIRARREKNKNVHAFVKGFIDLENRFDFMFHSCYYNPFEVDFWTDCETGKFVREAKVCRLKIGETPKYF